MRRQRAGGINRYHRFNKWRPWHLLYAYGRPKIRCTFYRDYSGDWGWTHGGIAPGFTTASLNISAFDVDFAATDGERNEIFASDNGVMTSLGFLDGADDIFSFTEFTLGANFFDDIAVGLQVFMDIDTTHNSPFWLVSLAKSVITTDGMTLEIRTRTSFQFQPPFRSWAVALALLGLLGWRRKKVAS